MADFVYSVVIDTPDGPVTLSGSTAWREGAMRLHLDLPAGRIRKAEGFVTLLMKEEERVFLNGFQTWSYSPEYKKDGMTRGLRGVPKPIVQAFHLDRYGDYHFVEYPRKKGSFLGESYGYLRDGAFFRLFASLDEEPGYTVFTYDAVDGVLKAERDCAGIACGGDYAVFDLFYAEGDEKSVFDRWFGEMQVKPLTDKPIAGYSSWYNRYEAISEKTILEDLEGCASVLEPGDLFQVDDGWEPNVGDWLEPDGAKFPGGMKAVADAIHRKGYQAGLWLAPFVARIGSEVEKNHPDWFLKVNGEKWFDGSNWGGFCSLDIDNPEVEAYLRETFRRVFDEWGFDLVKLDFLYGAAPYGTEHETRAGRMTRAMRFLREVCGEHAILGCGVPVMTAFGLVEYCRVSCDVSLDWDDKLYMRYLHRERVSTKQALETSIFRRQLNGRAFLSDPDVFFLRDDNIRLTKKQKENLAIANRLLGGVYLSSDNMGAYNGEKLAFYRELRALSVKDGFTVDAENGLKLRYRTENGQNVLDIYDK